MTEAEWLACGNPIPMLNHMREKATDRKLRLCICAACRRIWTQISQEAHRQAVEVGEQIADGIATNEARQNAVDYAHSRLGGGARACRFCLDSDIFLAAQEGLDAAIPGSVSGILGYAERKAIGGVL